MRRTSLWNLCMAHIRKISVIWRTSVWKDMDGICSEVYIAWMGNGSSDITDTNSVKVIASEMGWRRSMIRLSGW